MSRAAEEDVRHAVACAKAERRKAENAAALESSNSYVEAHDAPLARFRPF
ncbi:type II toxin-antitoxin system CcdA family antitoxin [Limimaricola cinnabarinus]|uniref:Post-segregation antitoxin CcdA n=1 Tax=Limimaricola cinnabarinus TaxID=1125964 RepID=A0A2G1MHN2_9RHOB|nr:type II toxin-antitoxin system CcdA family antitoxin [Limimaricola cinnabarinus]PHP28150.1 post-segregation antitoxin CcdA [Limimaricola cinnabarinus]